MKSRIGWLLVISLGLGWACAYDDTLRAYLDARFWLPYSRTPASFAKKNVRRTAEPYAGMVTSDNVSLRKLMEGYAKISEPGTVFVPATLQQLVAAARGDTSLTPNQREEVWLIDAKIEMRAADMSGDSFDSAEKKLKDFIRTARMPQFLSEARGWLAYIYHRDGRQTEAGKIYLDELNRNGSNLSPKVLLNSLKMTYGYDGGPELLAHLDEYFDTPEHAAFAIQLVTNPHWDADQDLLRTQDPAQTQKTYQQITELLERHAALLHSDSGATALGNLSMRVALRMGDPARAIQIAAEVPSDSAIRKDPDFNWMLGSANFLTHDYAAAEKPLLALFNSAPMNLAKYSAAYGLSGVYRKTGNVNEQIRYALWLDANKEARMDPPAGPDRFGLPSVYFAFSGFDLGLLMEDEASVEELKDFLKQNPNLPGIRVVKYSLAVRLARENRFAESAEIYESIHQTRRGPRMRQLQKLQATATTSEGKYELADFINNNANRIFYNDSLWYGLQRAALIAPTDQRLTRHERDALIAKERELRDQQEEHWRAYLILQEVVDSEKKSALGRKAALLAIRCLDGIATDRFGRKDEIRKAQRQLIAGLRHPVTQ